nr:MAG TPA: hypothetical protein [Caudoviricetes sp.]
MAQKERYELQKSNKNFIEIFDNVRDRWITEDNICELLNDYNKEIKELEAKVLTPFMKTLQEKKWEALREENRKLTEELDKYKETVQELQGTSSKMFDKLLENHLSKFQENPYYNEENEEFKKDLEKTQNSIAISELEVARNIASFLGCIEKDGEFYVNLTAMKGYLDGQIKMLKGE